MANKQLKKLVELESWVVYYENQIARTESKLIEAKIKLEKYKSGEKI